MKTTRKRVTPAPKEVETVSSKPQSFAFPSGVSYTPVIFLLFGVLCFLLGVFVTKVQYLENKGGNLPSAPQAANAQVSQAPQPPVAQAPKGDIKKVTDQDHVRGSSSAKVTLVEYSDLECPFCKTVHPTIKQLMTDYGDKVRWVYRHYPLSFHQNAQKEAEAAECVASLGGNDKFWQFVDAVFDRTTSNGLGFALDKLGPLASEIGLSQSDFQSCLDSGKFKNKVADDQADGTKGGVDGTPTTFVVDPSGKTQMIVGAQPAEAFKSVIDQALK